MTEGDTIDISGNKEVPTMSDERYNEWTSCQMYGHRYEQDEERFNHYWCRDCGDSYDDVDEDQGPTEEEVHAFDKGAKD